MRRNLRLISLRRKGRSNFAENFGEVPQIRAEDGRPVMARRPLQGSLDGRQRGEYLVGRLPQPFIALPHIL